MPRNNLQRSIKFQRARQYYLKQGAETHLNAKASLLKAGYAPLTAQNYARLLFNPDPTANFPRLRLDPGDTKGLITELNRWLDLMSKWRHSLEQVDNPLELKSGVFAVVSAHIERLAKIFGFIKEQTKGDTTINVNIVNLPAPQQYEELKTITSIMLEKIRDIENQMNIDEPSRFRI